MVLMLYKSLTTVACAASPVRAAASDSTSFPLWTPLLYHSDRSVQNHSVFFIGLKCQSELQAF